MSLEGERLKRSNAEWPRIRIKYLTRRIIGGGTPSKDVEAYWVGGEIPWVSPKDMKRRYINDAADLITVEAVENSATSIVPSGCPLVVVRSGILKHSIPVAINTVPVALNQDMKAFQLSAKLLAEFFVYWVEGQVSDLLLEWGQIGATVDNINVDRMLNAIMAVPEPAVQKEIVEFLDYEVGKIDQIIGRVGDLNASRMALPGTLLGLLFEKKRALICAAVTGRIDPKSWSERSCAQRRIEHESGGILG